MFGQPRLGTRSDVPPRAAALWPWAARRRFSWLFIPSPNMPSHRNVQILAASKSPRGKENADLKTAGESHSGDSICICFGLDSETSVYDFPSLACARGRGGTNLVKSHYDRDKNLNEFRL